MYGFSCGCGLAEHPHPPQTAMQLPALSRQQLLQQPLPPTTASSRSQPRRAGGRRKLLAVHQSARLHTSQLETWKGCACWFPAREHACTAAEGMIAAGCSKRAACAVGRVDWLWVGKSWYRWLVSRCGGIVRAGRPLLHVAVPAFQLSC